MIKRIDPNKPKIPLKEFKPETRPLDKVDSKLLEVMKKYQKRGVDLVNQITKAQEAEIERELDELEVELENERLTKIMEGRSKIPNDIAQRIASGEKFDDTNTDAAPKRKILTREEALRRLSQNYDKNK